MLLTRNARTLASEVFAQNQHQLTNRIETNRNPNDDDEDDGW